MIFSRFSTSFRDQISGLYSEAYFAEVFQREWHRMLREQDALSVIIVRPHLNISNKDDQISFKLISELVEGSTKRATDLVCRFQENEIAVGVFNLDEDGTETIINRMLENLESKFHGLIPNVDLAIGGLNVLPSNQIDIGEIFSITEDLASRAEQKGKNNYEVQYYQMH
jgi:PleD family two-component response regulator